MKTILARTSRSKSADLDVSDEDRSNASKALSSIGISVYDENGEYQDFSKTLDQLSEKWNTLSKSQQSYIAEQMAGIRNLNTMSAIIETWKDAKSIASDAVSDTGFIDETQEKYMDSVNAHINRLQTSIQELWNELLDTGAISTLTDALNLLINVAEKLIGVFSTIGDVLPVVNGGFVSLAGTVGTIAAGWSVFSNIKKAYKDIGEAEKGSDLSKKNGIVEGLKKTKEDATELLSSITGEFTKFKDGYKAASQGLSGFASVTEGLKGGWSALSGLTKGMIGLTAGIAVVSLAVSGLDALTTSTEESAEAANKAKEKYEKAKNAYSSHASTIEDIKGKYQELSKGVSASGENINLTTEQFEEYHSVCNKIADMYPTLIDHYDGQGNAVLKLKGNVEGLTKALEEERLAAAQTSVDGMDKLLTNFNNESGNKKNSTILGDVVSHPIKSLKTKFGYTELGYGATEQGIVDVVEEFNKLNKDVNNGKIKDKDALLQKFVKKDIAGLASNNGNANYIGQLESYKKLIDSNKKDLKKNWGTFMKDIESLSAQCKAKLESDSSQIKNALQNYVTVLTSKGEYANLDDNLLADINTLISNIGIDKLQELSDKGETAMKNYVTGIVKGISNSSDEVKKTFSKMMSLTANSSLDEIGKVLTDKNIKKVAKALGTDEDGALDLLGLEDQKKALNERDKLYSKVKNKYGEGFIKSPEQQAKKVETLNKEYNSLNKEYEELVKNRKTMVSTMSDEERYWGNVDEYNRKIISIDDKVLQEMKEKKQADQDDTLETIGGYMTTYGRNDVIEQGVLEGQQIMYTPILPDGTILSQDNIYKYIDNITKDSKSEKDVLDADKKGMKIGDQYIHGIINGVTNIDDSEINSVLDSVFSTIDAKAYKENTLNGVRNVFKNVNDKSIIGENVLKSIFETLGIKNEETKKEIEQDLSGTINEILNTAVDADDLKDKLDGKMFDMLAIAQATDESNKQHEKQAKIYDKEEKKLDKIKKQNDKINKATKARGVSQKSVNQFIEESGINTAEEIDLLMDAIDKTDTWEGAMAKFLSTSTDLDSVNSRVEQLISNITTMRNTLDSVSSATSLSNGATGLDIDGIKKLTNAFGLTAGSKEYDELFENTAAGIKVNAYYLDKLNKKWAETEKKKYSDEIQRQETRYQQLCVAIGNATEAKGKDSKLTGEEINNLIKERDGLSQSIAKLREAASMYDGLTSSYNQWIQAQGTEDANSGYLSIVDSLDKVKDLYDKGWVANDDFTSFANMFSFDDIDLSDGEKAVKIYETTFQKYKNWFTGDATGVENFLKSLKSIGAAVNKGDGIWELAGKGTKEIAQNLGVSESLVVEMLEAANSANLGVVFDDAVDKLENLKYEAEQAGGALKKALPEKYDIDLNVSKKSDIQTQLKKAKKLMKELGKDSEWSDEIQSVINYLYAKLGEIKKKDGTVKITTFVKTDSVDEALDKLHKMKKYKDLKINLKGDVTSLDKQIKEVNGELQKFKKDGHIDFSQTGANELATVLDSLYEQKVKLSEPTFMQLDCSSVGDAQGKVLELLQTYQDAANKFNKIKWEHNQGFKTKADVKDAEKAKNDAFNAIQKTIEKGGKKATILATLGINKDTTKKNIQTALNGINSEKLVKAKFQLTDEEKKKIDNIKVPDKKVSYKPRVNNKSKKEAVEVLNSIAKSRHVKYVVKITESSLESVKKTLADLAKTASSINVSTGSGKGSGKGSSKKSSKKKKGKGKVNGTAHANGTFNIFSTYNNAFAQGSWGASQGGTSLVGELGRELIVRGNRFFTVGDNGAEFTNIQKGDIIFNHKIKFCGLV